MSTTNKTSLTGCKVVVIGASAGIGKAFAIHAAKAGADLLMTGRRVDRLEATLAEAGAGATMAVDISDPDSCRLLRDEVARTLGSVDLVVSSAGTAPLRRIEETTPDEWLTTLRTNVIGINSVIISLLPNLRDGAIVVALSTEAVSMPRWALGAYAASKAGLEASIRAWRLEHPRLRFGTVGVGSTVPTEFGDRFDADILAAALEVWVRHGQAQEAFMDTDELGQVLVGLLAAVLPFPGINIEHVVLRTPSPIVGSSELMRRVASSITD